MKKIIFFITIFILVQILFVSCEKKANYPWPDNIENGVIATLDLLVQEEGVDPTIFDIDDLDNASAKFKIETPYVDEYTSLNLMVVVKQKDEGDKDFDFGNQYKVASYTAPGEYTITFNEILNVIDVYDVASDVYNGDKLKFFINVIKDGKELYGFLPLVRPTLNIEVEQEANATQAKKYKIFPGKCNVGDYFEFLIDGASSSRLKVIASGTDIDTLLLDMIEAIEKKNIDKPTGQWNTIVNSFSAKDTYIEVIGNIDEDFEITGIPVLKESEVSGYGPNILANQDFNFSENIIIK